MYACASHAPPADEGVSGDSITSMQESHFPARHILGTVPGGEYEGVSGQNIDGGAVAGALKTTAGSGERDAAPDLD
jgi:hypothetical protein